MSLRDRSPSTPDTAWNPPLYWAATGLFVVIFAGSVTLSVVDPVGTLEQTVALGYPAWSWQPLAVAKTLGLIAILSRRSRLLTGLAFAGFFYDTLLALAAHLVQMDLPYIALATTGMLATVAAYAVHVRRFPR